jgi:hypothetical protein
VEYEVELISPQLEPSSPIPQSFTLFGLSSGQALTTATAANLEFDEAQIDGLEILSAMSSGTLTLPCGMFEISGEVCVTDSSAETLAVYLQCYKNGADTSPAQRSQVKYAVVSGGFVEVPYTFYVRSDGTDTFALRITATGAAGTMSAVAHQCRALVRAL